MCAFIFKQFRCKKITNFMVKNFIVKKITKKFRVYASIKPNPSSSHRSPSSNNLTQTPFLVKKKSKKNIAKKIRCKNFFKFHC